MLSISWISTLLSPRAGSDALRIRTFSCTFVAGTALGAGGCPAGSGANNGPGFGGAFEFVAAPGCGLPAFVVVPCAVCAGDAFGAPLEAACSNRIFVSTAVRAPWLTWKIPASCAAVCAELLCPDGVKVSSATAGFAAFPSAGAFATEGKFPGCPDNWSARICTRLPIPSTAIIHLRGGKVFQWAYASRKVRVLRKASSVRVIGTLRFAHERRGFVYRNETASHLA